MPDNYWIRNAYQSRSEPKYYHDKTGSIIWQPDVYSYAARIAEAVEAPTLIDVGCGDGRKLEAFASRFRSIGIDFGENVERGKRERSIIDWRSSDLDATDALPVSAEELDGAVLICSDVVEHVRFPDRLIAKLVEAMKKARAVIVSTPERDLASGVRNQGPPRNPSHLREWNIREFQAFLWSVGMDHHSIGLSRSNDFTEEANTMVAVGTPTAADLKLLLPVLVDGPNLPPPTSGWTSRLYRCARILWHGN